MSVSDATAWVCACLCTLRARVADAPQSRVELLFPDRQEQDNQTDCWIRTTKEKVLS